MSEHETDYIFDLPKQKQSIIKVIGVGGGGSNAINHMFLQGIKGVEFIVCNTDLQALSSSSIPYKLQIGTNLTEGLGCGANPEIGKAAALESKDQILEMLTDTKMVFITAGMGGGTGTGAAPVLAKIAKDMGILTVGIITVPFLFEGKKKQAQAKAGIKELRISCDTVLVILNEKLRETCGNLSIGQAFAEADNVLTMAAKGIAEIITLVGYVNVDFQDVRTVMYNAGGAVMGSAETQGEDRAIQAARQALTSPLLDNRDIMGAKRILLSIVSGEEAELQMDELTQITEHIQQQAGDEAEMIFGHGIDHSIGDSIRVTVIATDFAKENKSNVAEVKNERNVHDINDHHASSSYYVDNSVNDNNAEIVLKTKSQDISDESQLDDEPTPDDPIEEEVDSEPIDKDSFNERDYEFVFSKDSSSEDDPLKINGEKDEQDNLLPDDQYKLEDSTHSVTSTDIKKNKVFAKTKERLQQQAIERREKIRSNKNDHLTKEELTEKWSQPAYLRRGVKMVNVPHSSEPYVSRYNLNEDNNLLGSNKFLHDNVD